MKKGFTLIELLAVIVILAIIALIATPIVLDIIDDSKVNSIKRSSELYLDGVEQAIARYQLNGKTLSNGTYYIMENGNLCSSEITDNKCTETEIKVTVEGNKPTGGRIVIKDGQVQTTSTMIIGEYEIKYDPTSKGYIATKKENSTTSALCELVEGTKEEVGSKYTCHLDSDRTFYVLEVMDDNISLLMDRNFTDGDGTNNTVSSTLTWCIDGSSDNTTCKNISSKEEGTPLKHIQDIFGPQVEVSIPTKEQIENSYTGEMPTWLYDNLSKYDGNMKEIESPFKGIWGYWTSSIHEQTLERAYGIRTTGIIDINRVDQNGGGYGIRPVIIVSKSKLN